MKLNLLIMGPAGAGKGTMSDLIKKHFRIAHISTGDMFREELKKESELGLKAKGYMTQGLLVPDELVIDMVLNRLDQPDCEKGYLLDGFPRSLMQATVFDTKVIDTAKEVNLVINLVVDEQDLFERIENRRVCRNCGKPISGRADKRFCCSRCKNEWNNSLNGPARHRRNRVLGILDKNYQVLKMVLESGERAPELASLADAGFRSEYVTEFRRIRRGRDEYRCFDISYNKTETRLYNIRRVPELE